jgi:dephospho-CoA kinase
LIVAMFLLGLTGSIGMGKSETARMFRRLGVPVYDADAVVADLYGKGGAAVAPIAEAFPGTVSEGAVDRGRLSRALGSYPDAWRRLESLVHPLTANAERAFLDAHAASATLIVVLDIPLLYETSAKSRVDAVVVVSAPAEVQRARALARPGMTEAKLQAILERQLPDVEKRRRADFIVETGRGLDCASEAVRRILASVALRPAEAWERRKREGG